MDANPYSRYICFKKLHRLPDAILQRRFENAGQVVAQFPGFEALRKGQPGPFACDLRPGFTDLMIRITPSTLVEGVLKLNTRAPSSG